jgi:putative membrane protein
MKSILTAVCCVALCCLPMMAQKKKAAAKGAPMTDQQFVDFAAQTDMTEAHLGQMAADQAASQGVKDYAQTLVTDHTNDYNQVTAVATKAGLNVPKGLNAEHEKMVLPFHSLKGAAFDHKYIQEMIAGHTKAIAVYTKESNDAQSADLKAYASAALPTLNKHLDGAKELAKAKPAGKGK